MGSFSSESPCSRELRLEVERRGSTAIVKLAGAAHMDVFNTLRDQLLSLIDESTPQLVLDLSDLDFINSAGLGALIAAHRRCQHHKGAVKLVAPQPAIEEILTVTKLTRILPVHPSVDAALASS